MTRNSVYLTTPEMTKGIREVLDIVDIVGGMPLPVLQNDGKTVRFFFMSHLYDSPEELVLDLARVQKAIGGRWHKNDPKSSSFEASYYSLIHDIEFSGGIKLQLLTQREMVCTPVVVGKTIKKIDAQPAVAAKEFEVDEIEYECHPLLKRADEIVAAGFKELASS